jgi:16S rRNA (cytidine1402-2'-O)-methyltransferase
VPTSRDAPIQIAPGTPHRPALALAMQAALERLLAPALQPGLHVVATPIGNLGDITIRALSVLARADVIYCEDTRHSLRLLQHYGLERPLVPYHEHNAERERPRILARLAAGAAIALISDAGTPLISDPGYKLVRSAREAGFCAWSLPGPSAPIAALSIAGLPTDRFSFEGFLPPKSGARRSRLEGLDAVPGTLVFFEAPQRLAETLADMALVLGPRLAVVARELTKLHEGIRSAPLPELAAWAAAAPVKGEIVILVAPADKSAVTDAEIQAALAIQLTSMSLRDAARHVALELGAPRSHVYQIGLLLPR